MVDAILRESWVSTYSPSLSIVVVAVSNSGDNPTKNEGSRPFRPAFDFHIYGAVV